MFFLGLSCLDVEEDDVVFEIGKVSLASVDIDDGCFEGDKVALSSCTVKVQSDWEVFALLFLGLSCLDVEDEDVVFEIGKVSLASVDIDDGCFEGDKGALSSCTFKVQRDWELFVLLILGLSCLDVEDEDAVLDVDKVTLASFDVDDKMLEGDKGALSSCAVKVQSDRGLFALLFLSLSCLDVEEGVVFEVDKVTLASVDIDD